MTVKPIHHLSVTAADIAAAEEYYQQHKQAIIARARLCEDVAVEAHGAYLGYRQAKSDSAAAWFVYRMAWYRYVHA